MCVVRVGAAVLPLLRVHCGMVVRALRVLLCHIVSGRLVPLPPPCVKVEASALLGLFVLVRVGLVHSRKPCDRLVVVCSVRIPKP